MLRISVSCITWPALHRTGDIGQERHLPFLGRQTYDKGSGCCHCLFQVNHGFQDFGAFFQLLSHLFDGCYAVSNAENVAVP